MHISQPNYSNFFLAFYALSIVCGGYCLLYSVYYFTDDTRELNKICDSLINFEITRDDLLKQDEKEVDLTTEEMYSPAKKQSWSRWALAIIIKQRSRKRKN